MQNTIYDVNPAFGEAIAAGTGNTLEYSSGNAFVGAGAGNYMAETPSGFIGAGDSNQIAPNGTSDYTNDSAIVGGVGNTVSVYASTIGGGGGNKIVPNTSFDVISGGAGNTISGALNNQLPTQGYTAISGGTGNQASGYASTISGGQQNTVSNNYDIISGGYLNTASGVQATISGGYGNTASGKDATIPGGSTNTAGGINSFAAGYRSTAGFNGDFVWSDYLYGSAGASATAQNEFVARATGGFYLYSSKSLTGVALAPGSGAWSTLSDRHVKTGIANVDDTRILAKLAAMPISEWSYKAQGMGVRHLGPMAQDFRAAFGLGEDDRHISTVDEEGVALAAIKALQAENAAKDREIAQLRRVQSDADQRLEAKYARLEQRLDALDREHNSKS